MNSPQLLSAPELVTPLLAVAALATLALMRSGRACAEGACWAARLALVGSGFATLAVALAGPMRIELAAWGPVQLAFLLDALSVALLLLVSFLGVIISRYAINYLDGDPQQARFSRWLTLTLVSVLTLLSASNLLILTAAWVATSLSLHQLLTLYRDRPAARLAARKKFLISRLGDLCMVAVLFVAWWQWGTWEFHEIFARPAGESPGWIAGLLVAAAVMKSAQFPFHSWLPDTMETPTPVSALMHAGIINAGGFLVLRLSPLLAQAPGALLTLALFGAFTALFASVVMMTQTSIKRSLAWSTVAQMGFMMLQCGLGAFALAALHLVAHALYKAHAFLSSGSIVHLTRSAWTPVGRPAAHPLVVAGSLAAAVMLGGGLAVAFGLRGPDSPGEWLLLAVFFMAMAHLLWTLWSSSLRRQLIAQGLALAGAATVVCLTLHSSVTRLLSGALPPSPPPVTSFGQLLLGLVGLSFLAVLVFQSQLPLWARRPGFARLYVHASNGFYIGTLFGRLARKLSL
jgi:NAD(P)H-quinone oxidoreductase subunit 5